VPTIRGAAAGFDANVPLHGIDILQHRIDATLAQDRLNVVLLVSFSTLGLLLATSGVYVAYGAAHRTYEIAIRRALGADATNIWRLVTREALVLVGVGLAIGISAAVTVSQMVSSLLFRLRAAVPDLVEALEQVSVVGRGEPEEVIWSREPRTC